MTSLNAVREAETHHPIDIVEQLVEFNEDSSTVAATRKWPSKFQEVGVTIACTSPGTPTWKLSTLPVLLICGLQKTSFHESTSFWLW